MEEKKSSPLKEFTSWVLAIVFGIAVALLCREYIFSPVVVKGASMMPTYENSDVIIVSKISQINRFDHIVFEAPYEDEFYIKRVIGLPGDTIEMKDDVLIINGVEYEEPYVNRENDSPLQNRITEDFTLQELTGKDKVPEGYMFVLGDNRLKSADSRHYGLISMDSILGESKIRIFPFNNIDLFW
nr:signal peptidase I [Lysinibacillus timonensis]